MASRKRYEDAILPQRSIRRQRRGQLSGTWSRELNGCWIKAGRAVSGGADWTYEPDETPKRKHQWDRDEAGFAQVGPHQVAKCPRNLSLEQAQLLLDVGIPWSPKSWRYDYPKRLYAVHQGVVYRGTPTVPGRSYHGFPELPGNFPRGARDLQERILQQARDTGWEQEVKRWMNW